MSITYLRLPELEMASMGSKFKSEIQTGVKYIYSGEGMVYLKVVIEKLTAKGIMIMTNSDNGESIFKELLELTIQLIFDT